MDEKDLAQLKRLFETVVAEPQVSRRIWPGVAEQILAIIAQNERLTADLDSGIRRFEAYIRQSVADYNATIARARDAEGELAEAREQEAMLRREVLRLDAAFWKAKGS